MRAQGYSHEYYYNNFKTILLQVPEAISNLDDYDNYYYCALLYYFSDLKFQMYKKIKNENLSFDLMNNIIENKENILYRQNFNHCFNKILSREGTLYSLLFHEYGSILLNKLSIILLNDDKEYQEWFLRDCNLLDLLYPFILTIYKKYGNDYWNRCYTYSRSKDISIYYILFHEYFTEDMYKQLITKLTQNKNINKTDIDIIRKYMQSLRCSEHILNELNSKLLLVDLS